jgi:hypothetical protein
MRTIILILLLCLFPLASFATETQPTKNTSQEESKQEEPPKPDSVWGALRYTGYNIKKGSIAAGHGIKEGSVKAGKTMEKGFKKAGSSIKTFFVGDD